MWAWVTRRAAPATRESRVATLARSPWTNTPRLWRGAPAPVLCRWCFFEDPDVMDLRIARLRGVHLLNATALLLTLHREGLLPEGLELVEKINTGRATPLVPFEKVGLTKRVRSSWLRRSFGR